MCFTGKTERGEEAQAGGREGIQEETEAWESTSQGGGEGGREAAEDGGEEEETTGEAAEEGGGGAGAVGEEEGQGGGEDEEAAGDWVSIHIMHRPEWICEEWMHKLTLEQFKPKSAASEF